MYKDICTKTKIKTVNLQTSCYLRIMLLKLKLSIYKEVRKQVVIVNNVNPSKINIHLFLAAELYFVTQHHQNEVFLQVALVLSLGESGTALA